MHLRIVGIQCCGFVSFGCIGKNSPRPGPARSHYTRLPVSLWLILRNGTQRLLRCCVEPHVIFINIHIAHAYVTTVVLAIEAAAPSPRPTAARTANRDDNLLVCLRFCPGLQFDMQVMTRTSPSCDARDVGW